MNFSRLAERLRSRMPLLDNDPEASRADEESDDTTRRVLEIIAEEIENEVQSEPFRRG